MSTTTPKPSSSRSATATPVRAIASHLANRSTPAFPPANQPYEPLVKSLFRFRLKFVLILSALISWTTTTFWILWQSGATSNDASWEVITVPFGLWTFFYTFISWAAVALPSIVLHKVLMSDRRSLATSPITIIKSQLRQSSTRAVTATYLVSAGLALLTHLAMVHTYEQSARGDPKLSLFVKSRKHPHYLNGRLIFLVLGQLTTTLLFILRGSMTDRFVYQWSHAANFTRPHISLVAFTSTFVSAVFATLSVVSAAFIFACCRFLLPLLYKIPFLSILLRPFTAHFLRGSWTITLPLAHLPLFVRAWFLALTTFVTWEIAGCLFENIVNEVSSVSTSSADPNTTLVSGIGSSNNMYKFFAYSELRELAEDTSTSASTRRTELFGDQKASFNLWAYLARESLILLGNDYQHFLRRGQPPPPPPVAPKPTNAQPLSADVLGTPTQLLRKQIFRSAKESPGQAALNALASDGPIAQAVDAGAEATHMPELFRSVEARVLSTPIAEEAKKSVTQAKGLSSRLKTDIKTATKGYWSKYAPEGARVNLESLVDWWTRERRNKVVEACLPFRELDVVVAEVLSNLVCASLTEDRYGAVQRDIPKILEAFISFLSAIEEYQMEIKALDKPPPTGNLTPKERAEQEALALEIEKAQDALRMVADGFKEGIARIVRTFGDKLLAFKFPPRIAQKLQPFLDYC